MARLLLLLPSATYRAPDFLAAAGRLGVDVVVGSEHRQALAADMGERALVVPFDDPHTAVDRIAELATRTPLDAVVAVDDQGVLVAARASERLGLPHNPLRAAVATRDKAALRRALADAGLPQPDFRVIRTGDDGPLAVRGAAEEVGIPCVVKPVSLSASRGVIRADSPEEAEAAAERVRRILGAAGEDPSGPLLVERFVAGAEVAVEGLLRAGELEVLAVFDKPDPLDGPYFEETLLVTPSRLGSRIQDAIARLVADAARALGLREGPVHAELRVGDGGALSFLELAARTIGGLCARTLRFGADLSLEEVVLRHALGLPLTDLTRAGAASGVLMIPIPRAGVLEDVAGVDAARALRGVAGVEITIPRGRTVVPLPEGDRYLGFVFARGDTPDDVERTLRAAADVLEVVIR